MHNHTGNPAITIVSPPVFSHISDGDELDESHLNPVEEQQDDYIAALLVGKTAPLNSATKWFQEWRYKQDDNIHPPQWIHYQDGSNTWIFQSYNHPTASGPTSFGYLEGNIDMALVLPDGCSLTRLELYLQGPSGHTLAITKPTMKLVSTNHASSFGTTTLINVSDPSPDFTTYEARHSIIAGIGDMPGGVPIVIDGSKMYSIIFTPESSPNNKDGTILGAVKATFDVSTIDRRAA